MDIALPLKAGRATQVFPVVVLLGLAVIATALLFLPLAGTFLHVSRDYNEGWNAYHVARLLEGLPLYPPMDAFISNNYPPLSFYVNALGTLAFGDPIIAARVISTFSLFIVALNIVLIVQRLCGSGYLALSAGIYFLVYVSCWFNGYIGIADPQWLGHALQTIGLLFLFVPGHKIKPISPRNAALCALLLLLGGLVKHNLLALPLTAAAWLLFYHGRKAFLLFTGAGLGFLILFASIFCLMFGKQWLQAVFLHSRVIELARIEHYLPIILVSIAPYGAAIGIAAAIAPRDSRVGFVMIYFSLALMLGFLWTMGAGVDINAYFDVGIASMFGVALCVSLLSLFSHPVKKDLFQAFNLLLLSLPLVTGLRPALEWQGHLSHQFWDRHEAAELIAALRDSEGPVACEDLAWCFWAGRDVEIDVFNYGQKILTGHVACDELLRRIETRYYKRIQISYSSSNLELFFGDSNVTRAIKANYEEEKRLAPGILLGPRARR
jgi:hypothetical protein